MDQSTDIGAINSSVLVMGAGMYAAWAAAIIAILIVIWYLFYRSNTMVNQPLKNLQHTYVANAVV
jgi:hypothetical protein